MDGVEKKPQHFPFLSLHLKLLPQLPSSLEFLLDCLLFPRFLESKSSKGQIH